MENTALFKYLTTHTPDVLLFLAQQGCADLGIYIYEEDIKDLYLRFNDDFLNIYFEFLAECIGETYFTNAYEYRAHIVHSVIEYIARYFTKIEE